MKRRVPGPSRSSAVLLPVLLALLTAAVPSAAQDGPAWDPTVGVALAAPTGASTIAIIAHFVDDSPEIYGVALGGRRGGRQTHFQIVGGRERGFGGRWIVGASYDMEWPLLRGAGSQLGVLAAPQLYVDRRSELTHLRLPAALRGTFHLLQGDVTVASVGVAGVAGGGTHRQDGWSEHAGVFGEAGVRVDIVGGWVQASALADRRLSPSLTAAEPRTPTRFTLRFGYNPPDR
jgi:hypothetical protein